LRTQIVVYTISYILLKDGDAPELGREQEPNESFQAGVAFETAALAFEDPNLITRQDRDVDGEQRCKQSVMRMAC
jgi:hypothetical protein